MLKIDDTLPYTEEEIRYLQKNKEYHAKKKLRRDVVIAPVKTKNGKDNAASNSVCTSSPQNLNSEVQKPVSILQHHASQASTLVREQVINNKRTISLCGSPSNGMSDAKEAAKQLLRSGAIKIEAEPKEKAFKPSSNLEKRLNNTNSGSSAATFNSSAYSLSPNSMENVKLQTSDLYSTHAGASVKSSLDEVVNQQLSYHQVPINSQFHKHFSNSLTPLSSLQQINNLQYFSPRVPMGANISINGCQQNPANRFTTSKTSHTIAQQQYTVQQQNYQMHQFPKIGSQNQHFSCLSPQMSAISAQQLPNLSPTPLPSMSQRFSVPLSSQSSLSQTNIGSLPSFETCEDIALYIRSSRGQLSYDSLKLALQPYGLSRLDVSSRGDSACATLGSASECRRAVRELNGVSTLGGDLVVGLIRRNNVSNSGETFPNSNQWNSYEFDASLNRMITEDRHVINYAANDFFT